MDKQTTGTNHTNADAMVRRAGVRMTRQRKAVLAAILRSSDHPTAAQIFERALAELPGLSLATVYNCLETMSAAGIINQLHFNNGPSRYCPNLTPHAHFVDEANCMVHDVNLKPGLRPEDVFDLPAGFSVNRMEVCLRGNTAGTLSK